MCGIAGTVYRQAANATEREGRLALLHKMADTIKHRGPDETRFVNDEHAFFAFNRLVIVGGEDGWQPFTNEDGTIFGICNGEIFNYQALKSQLMTLGHHFQTRSDCEVIVHLYEEYRTDVASHIYGQFAFAIYDCRRGILLLCRDRYGICPLYWTMSNTRLHFASEVKSIFRDTSIPRRIDIRGIASFALLYSQTSFRSSFQDIWQIPPGGQLILNVESWKTHHEFYWKPPFQTKDANLRANQIDEQRLADEMYILLQQAVSRRLQGDSKIGVYLSGGVDSSIIARLVYDQGIDTIFNITFEHGEYDEAQFQNEMFSYLNLKCNTLHCTSEMIINNLSRTIWHAETPLFRTAPVPMMMLSDLVHQAGFKVVLTGEGADEVFLGYPDFLNFLVQRIFAQYHSMTDILRELQSLLGYAVDKSDLDAIRTRFAVSSAPLDWTYLSTRYHRTQPLLGIFHQRHNAEASAEQCLQELAADIPLMYPDYKRLTPIAFAQLLEFRTKLSGYLLATQGDRMSMSHSVEQRFPFLDEDLVDLGLRTPEALRLRGDNAKYILRKSMAGKLPDRIANRPKQGYLSPNHDVIRILLSSKSHGLRELLLPETVARLGYFNVDAVQAALTGSSSVTKHQFHENKVKHPFHVDSFLIYVLSTHILHMLFIEDMSWSSMTA